MHHMLTLAADAESTRHALLETFYIVSLPLVLLYLLYVVRRGRSQRNVWEAYMTRAERHMQLAEAHMQAVEGKLDQLISLLQNPRSQAGQME